MRKSDTMPMTGLQRSVERLMFQWIAAGIAAPGLLTVACVWFIEPHPLSAPAATAAAVAWLAGSAVVAAFVTKRLSELFGRPAEVLTTLARIDAETDGRPVLNSGTGLSRTGMLHEFRALEDSLVRAFHEKNGRVNELTRARETAQAESEAKSNFFANMSHELRTPLNAIIGYAMLLSEDANDAGNTAVVSDLNRILVSSRHLLKLINDILDLSRLEAGRVALERNVVDVRALVSSVATDMADDVKKNSNNFSHFVAPNAAVMMGDATKLRHCLTALLGSAFKFNHEGDITLHVSLATSEAEPSIQFKIFDNSGDVPDDAMAALFEVARPGDNANLRKFDAAALDLALTQRLTGLMGGKVTVDTVQGQGSVFVLTLPMNNAADTAGDDVTPSQAAPATLTAEPSASRVVLVIDDDEPTSDLMSRWLSRQGYHVITAANGKQGLEMARSRKPDIIVLDIYMPGQSGYEVLAEIHADENLQNIPVILASSEDNTKLGLEAGAAEVLVKPLSRDRLSDVLQVLTERVEGDILVVDDDPDAAEIVQRYAHAAGLQVRLACDGEQGLTFARERRPGAIVLDLCMPGADGFQIMEALAQDAALQKVPVMVLSALDLNSEDHAKIRQAGHVFHAKSQASPFQIVQNMKNMVSR